MRSFPLRKNKSLGNIDLESLCMFLFSEQFNQWLILTLSVFIGVCPICFMQQNGFKTYCFSQDLNLSDLFNTLTKYNAVYLRTNQKSVAQKISAIEIKLQMIIVYIQIILPDRGSFWRTTLILSFKDNTYIIFQCNAYIAMDVTMLTTPDDNIEILVG